MAKEGQGEEGGARGARRGARRGGMKKWRVSRGWPRRGRGRKEGKGGQSGIV